MSLANKVVVVLGATGNVGSGIAANALLQGAKVVAVSRSAEKLEKLKQVISKHHPAANVANLVGVVGDFNSEQQAKDALTKSLQQHLLTITVYISPTSVFAVLGFADVGPNGVTGTSLSELKSSFESGLYNQILASQVFLPHLKNVSGSSYNVASGGFAHACYMPGQWRATIKNAAVNALVLGLASETAKDAVSVHGFCIHYGIAEFGGSKNQFAMDAVDTARSGAAFLKFASSGRKGEVICLPSVEDTEKLVF